MARIFLLFVCLTAAVAQTPDRSGSVVGTVRYAGSGTPIAKAMVKAYAEGVEVSHASSGDDGGFTLAQLPAGQLDIRAEVRGSIIAKTVTIPSGGKGRVNILAPLSAQISGLVMDQEKKPLGGIHVGTTIPQYAYGVIRYTAGPSATTNARGEYTITDVPAGVKLFVAAFPSPSTVNDAPQEIEKRPPLLLHTFYPGVRDVWAAVGLTLSPGEKRGLVDFKMQSSRSLCLEGTVRSTDAKRPSVQVAEDRPAFAWSLQKPAEGPGGHFRRCGLSDGEYLVGAALPGSTQGGFSSERVSIRDHDVTDLEIPVGGQPMRLTGTITWDDKPPDQPIKSQYSFLLQTSRGTSASMSGSTVQAMPVQVPVVEDDYRIEMRLPAGVYVKEVFYEGRNVRNRMFHVGPSVGDLRVVIAHDGATIRVTGTSDASVAIIPVDSTGSALEMQSAMITGHTDDNGLWTSPFLAPGKYYVVASDFPINNNVEVIDKLFGTLAGRDVVELAANSTLDVRRGEK